MSTQYLYLSVASGHSSPRLERNQSLVSSPVKSVLVHPHALGPRAGAYLAMSDSDEFLAWVRSALYEAELALHNGDAAPRRALWSRNEPVSVLGAWRSAFGQQELDDLFGGLERQFSDCTSYSFEVLAYDVVGDVAYTAGREHTSTSVDGKPRSYILRATQVYRREDGQWKVFHRHADTVEQEG
jgi:ketosteroid isomerase-like protein